MPSRRTQFILRQRCSQLLTEKSAKSTIFNSHQQVGNIAAFAPNEVKVGRTLGEGSFCSVFAVECVNHDHKMQRKNLHDTTVNQGVKCIGDNMKRDGKYCYAMKKMNPGIFQKYGPFEFAVAISDLATEAKLLSAIQHPYIIQMRGLADVDYCSEDFFIILDRVELTLTEKIGIWKKEIPRYGANLRNIKKQLLCKRLSVGHNICSALDYLHEKRIVYRDLSPENIGFDPKGEVKLYDLGFATEMTEEKRVEGTNTYLLTKNTGSPRYMAPEVWRGDPYNEKCDIYSFGLLLWQCTELMVPFATFNERQIVSFVYSGKATPCFNLEWSEQLRALFDSCWSFNFQQRYDCKNIMAILDTEMKALS